MSQIVQVVLARMRFFAIVTVVSAVALFIAVTAKYAVPAQVAEWLVVAATLSASIIVVDCVLATVGWAWALVRRRARLLESTREREATRFRAAVQRLRGCSVNGLRELNRLLAQSTGEPLFVSDLSGPICELDAHGVLTIVRNGHFCDTGGVVLLDPALLANKNLVDGLLAPILAAQP